LLVRLGSSVVFRVDPPRGDGSGVDRDVTKIEPENDADYGVTGLMDGA